MKPKKYHDHRGKKKQVTCSGCGKRYQTYHICDDAPLCRACQEKAGISDRLMSTNTLGEIVCWKDGAEKELLTYIERKHNAIVRYNAGKDFEMPWCRLCGTNEYMTSRHAVIGEPIMVTGYRKEMCVKCKTCGVEVGTTHVNREYCDKCSKRRKKANDAARYEQVKEARGK